MKSSKPAPRLLQQLLLYSTGSIVLVVLIVILGIWHTSDRAVNLIKNIIRLEPVKPQVEEIKPIIQSLQDIQQLSTTVQTIETIIPTSADRRLGDISIATTRLLYVARGEIRAGIDLSELTTADIKVSENQIEIDLPPAKILDSKIDVNHSRVYDYDRGFLNLGPDVAPQLQTLAQRQTLVEITETACQAGILNTAKINAEDSITKLLAVNGYGSIKVNHSSPSVCGENNPLQQPGGKLKD
ncbi:MAG: DUF4230 domain-containing protein [Cyanobacteria bacterium P01_A01_bin.83]